MSQPLLGISMIVKNEEKNLAKCLESIKEFDQLVIYDTGSTDKTVEIAHNFGAVIVEGDPIVPFHFGSARNKALDHATARWVMTIDADEILHPGAVKIIKDMIEKYDGSFVTGMFARFLLASDVEYDRFVIFEREAWRWRWRIHEELRPTGRRNQTIRIPQVVLEHTRPVMAQSLERSEQNFQLLKLDLQENPEHIRAWRHLGLEHYLRENWMDAIECLKRYIRATKDQPLEVSQIMLSIARAYDHLDKIDKALGWWWSAAHTYAGRRECYWEPAYALIRRKRWREAISLLEKAVAVPLSSKPFYHLLSKNAWSDLPERTLAWYKEHGDKLGHPVSTLKEI